MPPQNRQIPGKLVAAVLLLILSMTAGCEKKPKKPEPVEVPDRLVLTETSFDALTGWQDDRILEAQPALSKSCGRLLGQPASRAVGPEALAGTVADWRRPCEAIEGLPEGQEAALRSLLEKEFRPFAVAGPDGGTGVFTGYYEAELRGATAPDDVYRWPLYGFPSDLTRVNLGQFRADLKGRRIYGRVEDGVLVPYYDRAEIDGGALAGRDLELLWSDDPVDVFFLHIQGSGQVKLSDGSTVRIGFAGTNDLPFFAIGRALLSENKVPPEQASMQGIRDWLRRNPEEAAAMMRRNGRYIFFRRIEGEGPIGSQGVALTAGRSLAIDPKYLALGVPLWLETTWPASERPLRRLMVAQDTGGAIKGPVRGDFFWGSGEAALEQAGRMKQSGRYFLLLPKAVAERRRAGS